ncbi:RagB/SusD family nutrient uptake outer membrane protein [Pedobacter deserti]|uniref:RagB/SusD family nutrient uptake outer membrane protein n=1 Tax=Pedobacter deserti TaxID=2817382 RepID=UPI00210D4910|nr:RagB/SusD family nutrient uptake outer membrane protein [Pedobacter sp. SYSU D00382]
MKTKSHKTLLAILMICVGILLDTGCKKLVEVELPIDKTTAEAVFSNSGGASAALSNIYYQIRSKIATGTSSPSVINGLTADEFFLHNEDNLYLQALFSNSLSSNLSGLNYWSSCYDLIFRVNAVIEGVQSSHGIPDISKNELIGQAKFLRAFIYFYLANLYGDVPLVISTDYKINMVLPRSSINDVYDQIIRDLTEAQNLVSADYLKPDLITVTNERVTANKAVVTSLLARVYLYNKQWEKAEIEATKVIENSNYSILDLPNEVFLMNSKEAIWQIEGDISIGDNSGDGAFFIPPSSSVMPTVILSDNLMSILTIGDKRRINWLNGVSIGSEIFYYPFKYKQGVTDVGSVTTEYTMIFRLAEQYLIRSEARAHLNNLTEAIGDLNVIRKRAGVPLYSSLNQEELLLSIEKERQLELFSEWGHRWFDLKRTGRADEVLSLIKGNNWQSTDKLLPIPANELLNNPSLRGHQNPGYTEQ